MVYGSLRIDDGDFTDTVKILAETIDAYNAHKAYIENELCCKIIEEFVDTDAGSIIILPEDFKY